MLESICPQLLLFPILLQKAIKKSGQSEPCSDGTHTNALTFFGRVPQVLVKEKSLERELAPGLCLVVRAEGLEPPTY